MKYRWAMALALCALLIILCYFFSAGHTPHATSLALEHAPQPAAMSSSGSVLAQPVAPSNLEARTPASQPIVQDQPAPEVDPYVASELQLLEHSLATLLNTGTLDDARTVLWREALLILQARGEFVPIGPRPYVEEERPGSWTVTRGSERGIQLFYISAVEFPEYDEVSRLQMQVPNGAASPRVEDGLLASIRARVQRTLAEFGVDAE